MSKDIELQAAVCKLMLCSSCFGREVCPTPPCACAQSLIDAISKTATDADLALADKYADELIELRKFPLIVQLFKDMQASGSWDATTMQRVVEVAEQFVRSIAPTQETQGSSMP